jgi:hypothetical protein
MTETPAERPEAVYEMTAARRGLIMNKGKLTEHEGRYNELPEVPVTFRPMVGSYAAISAEACRRNEAQVRSGFMDYLYSPELQSDKPKAEVDQAEVDEAIKLIENRGAK